MDVVRAKKETHEWPLVDLPFYGSVALGNMTQFNVSLARVPNRSGWFAVGVEGHGFYIFNSWIHYAYAMEKLKLLNGDAMNLCDFLNTQGGWDEKQQGHYREELCS